MNVRLLRRVAKHIAEEPRRFAMGLFIQRKESPGDRVDEDYHNGPSTQHTFPSCGTAACIGGWTCLLKFGPNFNGDSDVAATQALGISRDESGRLFFVNNWPLKFEAPYMTAKTPAQRVQIAVARIEHFIKTKGRE